MDMTEFNRHEYKEECFYYDNRGKHTGPFHRYMWSIAITKTRKHQMSGILCESCAKFYGAWKLPDKIKK